MPIRSCEIGPVVIGVCRHHNVDVEPRHRIACEWNSRKNVYKCELDDRMHIIEPIYFGCKHKDISMQLILGCLFVFVTNIEKNERNQLLEIISTTPTNPVMKKRATDLFGFHDLNNPHFGLFWICLCIHTVHTETFYVFFLFFPSISMKTNTCVIWVT